MTTTYKATGRLTTPVSDLSAARAYLAQDDMTQYIHPEYLQRTVHSVNWDLTDTDSWVVTVVTHQPLTPDASAELSSWISDQNSDGLGEGFEQQSFAEHCERDAYGNWDDETYEMSSFDWQDNPCTLVAEGRET